jgi:tetratricopeptide (TPR) repeat protein
VSRRGRTPRRAAAALCLAFLAGSALPARAAGSDEVTFARATALARAGRCPEALAALAEMSAVTAQSAHLRAQCQLEAKDWPAALASLEETKRLDPAAPRVDLHLAVARFHMGDYAGSREALDRAAPSAQDDPQYHLYRGLVLLQAARSEEAARELGRARTLGLGVEPGASYYEGLAWAGADDKEKARESLDRVIETAPGTPWAAEAERAKADLSRVAGGRGRIWALARAGFEYDNNVRLRGEDVFRSGEGDHDVRGVWLLHGGAQLLSGPDWAAGISGTYYGTGHFQLSEFNEHYPVLGLWYDRRLGAATTLRLGYDIGFAWYQYDPFLFTQQVNASLFHDFGEAGRTELFVTPYKYNYLYSVRDVPDATGGGACVEGDPICSPIGVNESQERNHDGWGLRAGIEHRLPLDVLATELHGGVAYLGYHAHGREYSYNGVGSWIGTDTELPCEMAFRTSVAYSYLGYRHPSTYPNSGDVPTPIDTSPPPGELTGSVYSLPNANRREQRWVFAVELEKYITDAWSTSLRYSYTKNASNADVYAYDREIAGVYVTYRWNR